VSSGRLAVLFLLTLVGVLAALGNAVAAVAGPVPAAAYAVVVVVLLAVGAARARRARRPAALAPGRTCTCCASTVHDPVQVR